MPNRLAHQDSLYLRQHAENPVDWYPWGEEALGRAAAENRPILLSIGYSACHWCHVMAHESFEDLTIASVMNDNFVCIKVDREERPDVDSLYMQATVAMTGHGGWPMTVFLTPDGRPFYAGTYFPPRPRQGMPGFEELCLGLAGAFATRPDEVERTAGELDRRLKESAGRIAGAAMPDGVVDDAMVGLARRFDPAQGGFGGAPKFPPGPTLEFLLRRVWRRPTDVNAREMAELTLHRMADGGIHDQLGGGFHRYAVDGIWLIPHFEKMLYDNALLAEVYALAWRISGEARYREVAESTLDYLLREMQLESGGFAAAQDADSPGGEGAYFVWTPDQLDALLTPDEAAVSRRVWGITAEGNFEGGATVLHVANRVTPEDGPLLESARGKLLMARAERAAPARDDKVVTAWNGLAISALARAGAWFGREDYLDAAQVAADHLIANAVVGGRLMRTGRHLGCLDDYANLSHGLIALYEARFRPVDLAVARDLAAKIVQLFSDESGAGFFYTGSDAEALIARTRELEDQPTPAGSSQAARVLIVVAAHTGEEDLAERAGIALASVAEEMRRYPQAFGTALIATEMAKADARQIAVVGPRAPATAELVWAARAGSGPDDVLAAGDPDDPAAVAASPLLADRLLVDGKPAAYVCRARTCQTPVTGADQLAATLSTK